MTPAKIAGPSLSDVIISGETGFLRAAGKSGLMRIRSDW
jgi:hypothetical protein